MKKLESFAVWTLSFYFGWVLAFPYFGAVLHAASPVINANGDYSVYVFLLSHAAGYLAGGVLLKSLAAWKSLMAASLICTILLQAGLWFSPPLIWMPGMALLGFVSSFYVLGWGRLSVDFSSELSFAIFIKMIIRANLMTVTIIFFSTILSPPALLAVSLSPLLAALGLITWSRPAIAPALPFRSMPGGAFSGSSLFILCLFIAGLYLNTGFLFSVIHNSYPSMADHGILLAYLKYVPYLVTFWVVLHFIRKPQRRFLLSTGVSLLGLAFVSFALLGDSAGGFFLTVTCVETAFALINLFLWTLIAQLSSLYGAPYRFYGFALLANVGSTAIGGLFGHFLLRQGESPQMMTALLAAAAIFLTLIIMPWLREKIEANAAGMLRQEEPSPPPSSVFTDHLAAEAGLTTREGQIAALLLKGLDNRTIAARLMISENTLKIHLRNIYRKTGSGNKREFLARAAGSRPPGPGSA